MNMYRKYEFSLRNPLKKQNNKPLFLIYEISCTWPGNPEKNYSKLAITNYKVIFTVRAQIGEQR